MTRGEQDGIVVDANGLVDGKPISEHVLDIESLMTRDPTRYAMAETQVRYSRLLELQRERGEIDSQGEPVKRRRATAGD